jgi:hypothetical protein
MLGQQLVADNCGRDRRHDGRDIREMSSFHEEATSRGERYFEVMDTSYGTIGTIEN